MRRLWRTAIGLGLILALGQWAPSAAAPPAQGTTEASAELHDAAGRVVGLAQLTEDANGVWITLVVNGLPWGAHGIHIHNVGRCDPPDFASAGDHFNPSRQAHGLYAVGGPHAGDLPVLIVGTEGNAMYQTINPRVTLALGNPAASLFDGDGTALVIHIGPDDQSTEPAGNSGGRIACGVIRRS